MQVIVVGGGVAGAASAIALRRIGAEVTVYEAYRDPAGPVGSFLSLAVNGLRGLELLDLPPVRDLGFEVDRQRMWSASGRLLGDTPRGRREGDTLRSVTLMRGHLVEALRDKALQAGAHIVTGERLVDATTTPHGVRAEFSSGRTAEADLLIGADGIRSATRRILDPHAPEPVYAGLYHASGTASGLGLEPGRFNMIFARNGAFAHLTTPDGTTWWSAQTAAPTPPDPATVDLPHLAALYPEKQPSAILRAATHLHRPTIQHTLAEVPVWHDDRIVLVGDAGHPVGAGQGASMAVEDAVVLAGLLATSPAPAALAAYDQARRARIGRMAKAASKNRDAKTAGPIRRRLNDVLMSVALRHFHDRATGWLYTHRLDPLPVPAPR